MSDGLYYPWPEAPAPGGWREVAPGVRWLRLPLPFALDHINVWLLADEDGWTLVDTGIGYTKIQPVWQTLFETALEGRPLRRILVTHYHPDHVGQAAWLSEHFGAPVWMAEEEYALASRLLSVSDEESSARMADMMVSHGLNGDLLEGLRRHGNGYRRMVKSLPGAVHFLRDDDVITVGDRRWRVIIGRGHAPEHICLASESGDLLISGDQVLPRISTNISMRPGEESIDPLGLYLASLERLSALPASIRVLPSHGLVFDGLHHRLDALAAHHRVHLQHLLDACDKPQTAADVLPVLFKRELDGHSILFAMGESIAHLHHLHRQGKLLRSETEPYRYAR